MIEKWQGYFGHVILSFMLKNKIFYGKNLGILHSGEKNSYP